MNISSAEALLHFAQKPLLSILERIIKITDTDKTIAFIFHATLNEGGCETRAGVLGVWVKN